MGARRTEAPSASMFGWEAAAPVAAIPLGPDPWAVTDELGTAPMFAAPVGPGDARHAPEPVRCDWPDAAGPDGSPADCGRPAVASYVAPDGDAYPRCRRHDTVAAQRRAAADGWDRRALEG